MLWHNLKWQKMSLANVVFLPSEIGTILGFEYLSSKSTDWTPNEGINQRNLKIWANVADKICFGHT